MSCHRDGICPILSNALKTAPVPPRREPEGRDESFASRRWTRVIEAGNSATASAHALKALSEFCQTYWRPLYVLLRKQGNGPEDARHLTQGVFTDLIETRAYAHADREKERSRPFLLPALKHSIADTRDGRAVKLGGGMILARLKRCSAQAGSAQRAVVALAAAAILVAGAA